ncbi:hypothetical protein MA16_Dca027469 [Dendrobium catenatum]|uniref:Uncharacterized protein n=1 Tax=Dendrobium catenatum TaxID=906689 RepID=A0A2I0VYT3_9ASPA|nr:hypothetical protein MA16_Dca027469 [Dendrobium catenatum]
MRESNEWPALFLRFLVRASWEPSEGLRVGVETYARLGCSSCVCRPGASTPKVESRSGRSVRAAPREKDRAAILFVSSQPMNFNSCG